MNIAVVGTGYVGLVTGTCLAETGNNVTCVDIDQQKVKRMQQGELPIYEPGLDILFHRNIEQGRLCFTTNLEQAISNAKVIFLALPTPPGGDGSADLRYVEEASQAIAKSITAYKVVVTKSTVPVGTSDRLKQIFLENTSIEVDIVSNPEFLREGVAVDDFMKPDRVIIGSTSVRAQKIMEELYGPYLRSGNPIIFMDERSSELTKYAANAFLATKISFMNEIANLCERLGADVDWVRMGIGSDERIGKRFLFPGVGYGGSCFPKDIQALARASSDHQYNFKILQAVMLVNEQQKKTLMQKISKYYHGNLINKRFALWGLAFKPGTDDIREAPALFIIDELIRSGAEVVAYDPEAMGNVKHLKGNLVSYAHDPYEALQDADALIIVTEWPVFRTPDFDKMAKKLRAKVIFDGRNLYDLDKMYSYGYYYSSIGRRCVLGNHEQSTLEY